LLGDGSGFGSIGISFFESRVDRYYPTHPDPNPIRLLI
jgi:hypothetical protein